MKELTTIQSKIHEIRGQQVMLDFDLAALYQVETKVLKQAVRRNIERFPEDFIFEISNEEYNSCLLYTSPSPRDYAASRMPSSA